MLRLALHGGYYFENFGDLLLFDLFKRWIAKHEETQTHFPMVPFRNRIRFSRYFSEETLRFANPLSWQALIYAGGGHFEEPDETSGNCAKRWNSIFLKQHFFLTEWFIQRKQPYALIAVGAGPIKSRITQFAAKRIMDHASMIVVRDQESKDFIHGVLHVEQPVTVLPDPVVSLTEDDIPEGVKLALREQLMPYRKKKLLGIHFTNSFLGSSKEAQLVLQELLSLLSADGDVVPVVFTDYKVFRLSINDCMRIVRLIEQSTGRSCLCFPFRNVWETVALISQLDAVMTPKLHVGISAYAFAVPCESFATNSKIPRFYTQVGWQHCCHMMKGLTKEHCKEKMNRLWSFLYQKEKRRDLEWYRIKEAGASVERVAHLFIDQLQNRIQTKGCLNFYQEGEFSHGTARAH